MLFTIPTENWLMIIIILLYLLYIYSTRNFNYWKKRNVPGPKPKPFVGNLWDTIATKHSIGVLLKNIYSSFDGPFVGMFNFNEPALLIREPDIIKHVLLKDFEYFQDRVFHEPAHNPVIGNILFVKKNPSWKEIRSKVTPIFSSSKLNALFPILSDVCKQMIDVVNKDKDEQEVIELCCGLAVELLSQSVLGIEANCFKGNSEIKNKVNDSMGFTLSNALVQASYFFDSSLVKPLKLEFLQYNVEEFFKNIVQKCFDNANRLNSRILIKHLLDVEKKDAAFGGDVIMAQVIIFFLAGVDTTTTTISMTLYELSLNPQVQEKVRSEIQDIIAVKGYSIEGLKEMKYLDMCIHETLRKYPGLPFLDRKCLKDYKIPGSKLVIEKGTAVYISPLGMHYDENYFADPEQYIPERFLKNVNEEKFIYSAFGHGQRACVAARYGKLMTKTALMHILSHFSVEKYSKTPSRIEIDPTSILLRPKDKVFLRFKKL